MVGCVVCGVLVLCCVGVVLCWCCVVLVLVLCCVDGVLMVCCVGAVCVVCLYILVFLLMMVNNDVFVVYICSYTIILIHRHTTRGEMFGVAVFL